MGISRQMKPLHHSVVLLPEFPRASSLGYNKHCLTTIIVASDQEHGTRISETMDGWCPAAESALDNCLLDEANEFSSSSSSASNSPGSETLRKEPTHTRGPRFKIRSPESTSGDSVSATIPSVQRSSASWVRQTSGTDFVSGIYPVLNEDLSSDSDSDSRTGHRDHLTNSEGRTGAHLLPSKVTHMANETNPKPLACKTWMTCGESCDCNSVSYPESSETEGRSSSNMILALLIPAGSGPGSSRDGHFDPLYWSWDAREGRYYHIDHVTGEKTLYEAPP
jgi:hypothetical protein